MKIEFTTGAYMRSHGRQPKGRGHWGFAFEGYEYWACGTLTEAKKACRAEVKRLAPAGYTEPVYVTVLP